MVTPICQRLPGRASAPGTSPARGREKAARATRPPGSRVQPASRDRARVGFTVLETLVVLAIIAILAGGGWVVVHRGGALRAAQGARTFVLWARLQAIWTGRVVAVVPGTRPALSARAGDDVPAACQAATTERFELARYGGVRVQEPFRAGIAWLPSGSARSCDGGGVISGRMVLAAGSRHSSVIVSSLGRVRVESGP